jgi:hypothetical protein
MPTPKAPQTSTTQLQNGKWSAKGMKEKNVERRPGMIKREVGGEQVALNISRHKDCHFLPEI